MSEDAAIEGALVLVPKHIYNEDGAFIRTDMVVPEPAADIRYEDDEPDKVANVLVVVTYVDGRVKEYEARQPENFTMNDPESISAQVFRQTGLALGSGDGFRGVTAGVPSLRLSFSAHPRYNLHIRNRRKDTQPSQRGAISADPGFPGRP